MNWRNYVNVIALIALMEHKESIRKHCSYGWKIGVLYPYDETPHYDYNWGHPGYSFAQAVTDAAKIAAMNANLGFVCTWVEPDEMSVLDEETEYCMWILRNNFNNEDYTTMENMAAGRKNLPNCSGVMDRKYDKEYETWIEEQLSTTSACGNDRKE